MSMHAHARNAYGSAATPARSDRSLEYALFAKITHRMSAIDETKKADFPALASAVYDNQRLWMALAEDLMHEGNALPVPLRAQLIGLAEFVRKHSLRVLGGKGSVAPLIDINTSIMRGLRGVAEAEA